MEITPVSQIEPPAYPTRNELLTDRKSLYGYLPDRWRKSKRLAGALSLFLAANCAGCNLDVGGSSPPTRGAAPEREDPFDDKGDDSRVAWQSAEEVVRDALVEQAADWTRSIFRGRTLMMGCVAMMPPAVLHEDAAAQAARDSD